MKAAASLWKSSTREHKDGWVERANQLNKTPLLVYFKGEIGLSYHLISVAAVTKSEINNSFWINVFLE